MKFRKETSAGGIVFKRVDDKILWLIVQHSQHKGWGFPKGLVGDTTANEAKEVAALREVQEEGGVKARIVDETPVKTKYKFRWEDNLVDKTVYFYLMEYISGNPTDHDWEVLEAKFVTTADVRKTIGFKTEKEAFEKVLTSSFFRL